MSEKVQELPVAQVERPRFFIDHGMVHDRQSGKHLVGAEYAGEKPETLLAVLRELEAELWAWKQAARGFSECNAALLAERDALRETLEFGNAEGAAWVDRAQAAETELARLRGQGEALVAKWRDEADYLPGRGNSRRVKLECADELAAAMSTEQEASND